MNNNTKGKIAENIVANLFQEAGFKVFHYGYEYVVPELADKFNVIKGRASNFIRHQPDLIVVNKDNYAFFVEVKFRGSAKIDKKDMFPYPETYVLFLTKDLILCQSLDYIFEKGEQPKMLNEIAPFSDIPSHLIAKYVKIVRRKLGDENLIGQLFEGVMERIAKKPFKKNITPPEIIGIQHTISGWDRINTPEWVFKAINRRGIADMLDKKNKPVFINGETYQYKVQREEDNQIRGYRKLKREIK